MFMNATATSRFRVERRLPDEREFCVVGFVGFQKGFSVIGRGLLERCAIHSLEFSNVDHANRALETLTVDALVVDCHHAQLKQLSPGVRQLLASATAARGSDRGRSSLIVLGAGGVTRELVGACHDVGALFLPPPRQTFRQIAALVRQVCGLPDGCCVGSAGPPVR